MSDHPFSHTAMPLDLAKRMIEQRGGYARENELSLAVYRHGRHLGELTIAKDDTVRFLDICGLLALP
jgi:hypothetical protein